MPGVVSRVYWNIPEYALVSLGAFLYSTNIVTVPFKRGKSITSGEGWHVIRNPNFCLGDCVNFNFVPVPLLAKGLRP
jgi:hypothetical protein